MSEFAREAVLTSVDLGGAAKPSLGGDLVTLTSRLQELDKLLRTVSGVINRVLGEGEQESPGSPDEPRGQGGGGVIG
jgi:hypothetical protein